MNFNSSKNGNYFDHHITQLQQYLHSSTSTAASLLETFSNWGNWDGETIFVETVEQIEAISIDFLQIVAIFSIYIQLQIITLYVTRYVTRRIYSFSVSEFTIVYVTWQVMWPIHLCDPQIWSEVSISMAMQDGDPPSWKMEYLTLSSSPSIRTYWVCWAIGEVNLSYWFGGSGNPFWKNISFFEIMLETWARWRVWEGRWFEEGKLDLGRLMLRSFPHIIIWYIVS